MRVKVGHPQSPSIFWLDLGSPGTWDVKAQHLGFRDGCLQGGGALKLQQVLCQVAVHGVRQDKSSQWGTSPQCHRARDGASLQSRFWYSLVRQLWS